MGSLQHQMIYLHRHAPAYVNFPQAWTATSHIFISAVSTYILLGVGGVDKVFCRLRLLANLGPA